MADGSGGIVPYPDPPTCWRIARPGGQMSTRRRRREQPDRLPSLLVCLIHAAKRAPHDSSDRTGHDAALAELGRWALIRVPSDGVLAPDAPDAFTAIQEIAKRRLQLDAARAEVKAALSAIESFETRD